MHEALPFCTGQTSRQLRKASEDVGLIVVVAGAVRCISSVSLHRGVLRSHLTLAAAGSITSAAELKGSLQAQATSCRSGLRPQSSWASAPTCTPPRSC